MTAVAAREVVSCGWCPADPMPILEFPDREFVSMPELPDVTVYVEAIEARLGGQPLSAYAILSPFILRTVEPPFIS